MGEWFSPARTFRGRETTQVKSGDVDGEDPTTRPSTSLNEVSTLDPSTTRSRRKGSLFQILISRENAST